MQLHKSKLKDKQGESVWRETSRWIKFEENVDQGGSRWSKAHVGTISISVMKKVRAMLQTAHFFFDERHENLHDIIEADAKAIFPTSDIKNDILTELISERCYKHLTKHNMNTEKKVKRHFASKIPPGAEGCVIMTGNVEFLEEPLVMFIRLEKPKQLTGITEVTIDKKFLIVALGKETYLDEFHQIGRVFGNIMADPVVKNVAYKASTKDQVIQAFEEFASSSVAMSPNQWDPRIRLQPPVVQDQGMERLYSDEFCGHSQGVGYGDGGTARSNHELDDALQRTGRLFGGMINDIKRKKPFYLSDFTDGFNMQCVATVMFLYFAIITPIVTFGGLLADATNNNIAAIESMVGGMISGVIYHLFSGQPLTIIGSTGPILVFETIMYQIATDMGMNYLELRVWVGLFIGLMTISIVAFDLSYVVMYITRYTEESFSTLISLIFITDGFKKLLHLVDENPINSEWRRNDVFDYNCSCQPPAFNAEGAWAENYTDWEFNATNRVGHGVPELTWATDQSGYHCISGNTYTWNTNLTWSISDLDSCMEQCGVLVGAACPGKVYTPDVFFFSLFLAFGTLFLSFTLKGMRGRRFFPVRVRQTIAEFSVVIAILAMVSMDIYFGFETPKLHVPSELRPTRPDRGWLINPMKSNGPWAIALAVPFALMGTILIFMDQQITAVIVNRRENKLTKGVGYHLDLFVCAIALIICSIMGLPWFIAATVLSITHVNALKKQNHEKIPGEPDTFAGVVEQRLTGLLIFIFIGKFLF